MDSGFLEEASDFLACFIAHLPFNFLGIPIGINSRRRYSWVLTIEKFHYRLSSWKGKLISFGGCIVILNVVLKSIPLYIFSFYKAPKLVIQEISKMQQFFLCKGEENKRKINWISLSCVCVNLNLTGVWTLSIVSLST